jgi:lipid-A-disaccharide synthase
MKYYLIAGEASGDLHASRLMHELRRHDAQAQFRYYGGDLMQSVGGTLVKHYRDMAYMGFIPVMLHLPTILRNMSRAKRDIRQWQPDVIILVDYPGFNLKMASYVHKHSLCPVFYYIAPKIWAWKEYRIKNIKRDVDSLFSILPFEVQFFEKKHHYPIHYVGNPTADEVREYRQAHAPAAPAEGSTRVIALLAGSRRQEIRDNLPPMIRAARNVIAARPGERYELVLAGAPAIDDYYYRHFIEGTGVRLVKGQTYDLLARAHVALVTSGTATLEAALFGVPQVVCYAMSMPRLMGWLRKKLLKVKYVSLVNLIADSEVVTELVADTFSQQALERELTDLLDDDSPRRQLMTEGYGEVWHRLGTQCAPQRAASTMVQMLTSSVASGCQPGSRQRSSS